MFLVIYKKRNSNIILKTHEIRFVPVVLVQNLPLTTFCVAISLMLCGLHLQAVVRGYSVKKVFLEILQNLRGNNCARVSFLIKLQALGLY